MLFANTVDVVTWLIVIDGLLSFKLERDCCTICAILNLRVAEREFDNPRSERRLIIKDGPT